MSDSGERARLLGDGNAGAPPGPEVITVRDNTDSDASSDNNDAATTRWAVTKAARRLYVSHLLSTWNSRVFEFGSVLYLATIFPGTLLPMSVYAIARAASAILLSSLVGQYIDTGNRLQVVRVSIGNFPLYTLECSGADLDSSATFCRGCELCHLPRPRARIAGLESLEDGPASCADLPGVCREARRHHELGVCREGLGTTSSTSAWVLARAAAHVHCRLSRSLRMTRSFCRVSRSLYRGHDVKLILCLVMNSQMRRIDLICKLLGPFVIALVDGVSTELAILVSLGMNVASILPEYLFIAQVGPLQVWRWSGLTLDRYIAECHSCSGILLRMRLPPERTRATRTHRADSLEPGPESREPLPSWGGI